MPKPTKQEEIDTARESAEKHAEEQLARAVILETKRKQELGVAVAAAKDAERIRVSWQEALADIADGLDKMESAEDVP